MPMLYRIDHEARVVVAAGHGVLTDADVFGYQREVWSRPEVKGYAELVDMTHVTEIALPSPERIKVLAALAADMDQDASSSRFAILAPSDIAFGLGRMFQAYRESHSKSTKEVGVFRTMEEVLAFLRIRTPLEMPADPTSVDRG